MLLGHSVTSVSDGSALTAKCINVTYTSSGAVLDGLMKILQQ